MTKRLRNEEEKERESPEAKKQTRNDDVEDDIVRWLDLEGGEFSTDERFAAINDELAKLLDGAEESEASAPAAMKVRFTENPYLSSSAVAASSFVTINRNEETCGSSFSDWDSSVMASIDIGGLGCCYHGHVAAPEPPPSDIGGGYSSCVNFGGACSGGEGVDQGFDWINGDEGLARFMEGVFSEESSLV